MGENDLLNINVKKTFRRINMLTKRENKIGRKKLMRLNNLLNINGIRTFFGRINTLIKWENKIRSEKN